jgi:hypothetical protein
MTEYIYRIDSREDLLFVQVGIWDPDRWKPQSGKTRTMPEGGWGGMRFGFTAEMSCTRGWAEEELKCAVSQGSIGFTPIAESLLRVDVYEQACMIGRFVEDMLTAYNLTDVATILKTKLSMSRPTTERFTLKEDS